MKKWYKVNFSALMDEEDVRAMKKCFYDAMGDAMEIEQCANLSIVPENESYTAFVYSEDTGEIIDETMYDSLTEAIDFAKLHNWDEVVNDVTGEVMWEKE